MPRRYDVSLTGEQRQSLVQLLCSKKSSTRQRTHARILLRADTSRSVGSQTDVTISQAVRASTSTVARVRRRFAQEGLQAALYHQPQVQRKARRLDGVAEAHLIALVCGAPPEGRKRWSLHLLKDTLIQQGYTDAVSHETVRQTLKKTPLSLG